MATGIFAFILAWNEFIFALVIMNRPETQTMPVWLQAFNGGRRGTDWGGVMAGSTVMATPVVIFFLIVKRRVTAGLTAGRGQGLTPVAHPSSVSISAERATAPCPSTTGWHRCSRGRCADAAAPPRSPMLVVRLVGEVVGEAVAGWWPSACPGTSMPPRRGRRRGQPRHHGPGRSPISASRVGVPVHVENDVNAAALGAFAHLELAPAQSLTSTSAPASRPGSCSRAGWRGVGRSR